MGQFKRHSILTNLADDCSGNNPADWCADHWCIVDPNNCVFKARDVTYTLATDYSSYETCDTNFNGNSWVGTAACKDKANSFCMATPTPPTPPTPVAAPRRRRSTPTPTPAPTPVPVVSPALNYIGKIQQT